MILARLVGRQWRPAASAIGRYKAMIDRYSSTELKVPENNRFDNRQIPWIPKSSATENALVGCSTLSAMALVWYAKDLPFVHVTPVQETEISKCRVNQSAGCSKSKKSQDDPYACF